MKTVKVVAAVIKEVNDKGEPIIFATQRGYGEFKDGWEFPGGKIEAGETPQEALKREIMEELDTKVKIGNLIDTIEYDYPNFHLLMDCFWCEIVSGELKLKEHENAKWLTKEHLDEVEWLPADVIFMLIGYCIDVFTEKYGPGRLPSMRSIEKEAYSWANKEIITIEQAAKRPLGSVETCNKRTINQFIHPDVLKTCQLSMGMTELESGSNWNTMPSHTHERRMEIYTYFELPEGQVVFHMCGEPTQTRHIVMHNEDAVISPSWSIHSGVGTSNYTFIWAMGGENMEFDDMDNIATTDLR